MAKSSGKKKNKKDLKKEGYSYKKTAPQSGAVKKPKTKAERVGNYEELPVIVRFEI